MDLLAGTSGYAYKEWKGTFYDADTPAATMLEAYAHRLPAVEINNTFYRLPKKEVLAAWRDQVPDGFRFAVKASRRITHLKRLRGVQDETRYLLGTLAPLGDRLGAVLFQLPPNLKKDIARLDAFLNLLPAGLPAAFEFRNRSWVDEEVRDRIAAGGGSLCATDTGDPGDAAAFDLAAGGPWGYLRMRRERWTARDLAALRGRIEATGWPRAFVFFKHEEGADAPAWAERLIAEKTGRGPGR